MATDNIARMMALDAAQQGGSGGTSDYDDLTNKPSINGVTLTGAKTSADLGIVSNMQANWAETNPESGGYIWNKPENPGNGTVSISRNGTQISAFTLNQSSDTYVDIAVPDVDAALSSTSTNPVQNKVVQSQLARLFNSGAKNLVKPPKSSNTILGVTTTINADGSITLNGTCTASTFSTYIFGAPLLPAGSYRLSGCPAGGSGTTFELSCGGGGLSKVTDYGNSAAFTLTAETQLTYIQIVARAGAVFSNTTFFPMLCTAEDYAISPEFVPYAKSNYELTQVTESISRLVDAGAKNLLKVTATSQTINGVTFTVDNNGTITANGTATETVSFVVNSAVGLDVDDYVLSGCPSGGGWNKFYVTARSGGAWLTSPDFGSSALINGNVTQVAISIQSGQTVSNLTFRPMICTAENYAVSSEFVPYAPTNRELYEMILELNGG